MFRRWGKGCPGSTARGVSAGKTAERKCSCTASRWVRSSASGASSSTPWERSRGTSSSRQTVSNSRTISRTSAVMAWNCSVGERPSASVTVTPDASCCLMPATRTMKNSSRLAEAMERNRTRSYGGSVASWASPRMRRLKASALSSRLMNILGSFDSTVEGGRRTGASIAYQADDDDVKRGSSQACTLARRSALLHHYRESLDPPRPRARARRHRCGHQRRPSGAGAPAGQRLGRAPPPGAGPGPAWRGGVQDRRHPARGRRPAAVHLAPLRRAVPALPRAGTGSGDQRGARGEEPGRDCPAGAR